MSRSIPLGLGLLLSLAVSSASAEPIHLLCSGKLQQWGDKPLVANMPNMNLYLDEETRIVTFTGAKYLLLDATNEKYRFESIGDKEGSRVQGTVNRYTGETEIHSARENHLNWLYKMTCKRAKDLF